jgi:PKD repeat protein
MASRSRALLVLALAAAVAGCTVKKTEPPPLSGPSVLSLSLSLAANPDTIAQDGASQSQIVVSARDANAQPVRSLAVRLDLVVDGAVQDFGKLSAKNIVTGSDGTATVFYTAPPSVDNIDRQVTVFIYATPVSNDATAAYPRSISIKLVPPGVIEPPTGTAPEFTITPTAPIEDSTVNFVAAIDNNVVSYHWSFGDGGTATGRIADHVYRNPNNYLVTLTVTDATGATRQRSKDVSVAPGEVPKAEFTFSPTEPQPNQTVFFSGAQSTPADGRSIISYRWDFGDGATGSGISVSHKYTREGTFNVNLTVTDNAGLKGAVGHEVPVKVPIATP